MNRAGHDPANAAADGITPRLEAVSRPGAGKPDGARSDGHGVQSVDRAALVLKFLAGHGWSGSTEVGESLGVHKSTAFRLLSTLERHGLVTQHEETGKYHLGFGLVHLARAVTVGFDLRRHARPTCERLAEETGETVVLAVLDGARVLNIDQVIPRQSSVMSVSWVGRHIPLHATASGKALLAHLPDEAREQVLDAARERYTPHTIVERSELEQQLAAVQRDGYACAAEEFDEALNAVAAPIVALDGELLGAVSVSAPAWRLPPQQMPETGELVRSAAAQIGSSTEAELS